MENLEKLKISDQDITRELGFSAAAIREDVSRYQAELEKISARREELNSYGKKEFRSVLILLGFLGLLMLFHNLTNHDYEIVYAGLFLAALLGIWWNSDKLNELRAIKVDENRRLKDPEIPPNLTDDSVVHFSKILAGIDAYNALVARLDALQASSKIINSSDSDDIDDQRRIYSNLKEKRCDYIKGLQLLNVYMEHSEALSNITNGDVILDQSVEDLSAELASQASGLEGHIAGASRVNNDPVFREMLDSLKT